MAHNWKPSRSAARAYAQQMQEIDEFCALHGITQSRSGDSYYFSIRGTTYRVSNHTIEASNRRAYNDLGEKIRDLYHPNGEEDGTVYITASKTRIIEIYNDLRAGYQLDRRGFRKY